MALRVGESLANRFGGHSRANGVGRQIFDNNRTGAHDAAFADANVAHDNHAKSDEIVAFDKSGAGRQTPGPENADIGVIEAVVVAHKRNLAGNQHIVADFHVRFNRQIFAGRDVVAKARELGRTNLHVPPENHVASDL